MEQQEFRVAAALLAVVVLGIAGIFYVRVSGAESLRAAFADPYDSSGWGDDDYEEWEECYEIYEEVGLWGFGEGLYSTEDTHAENLADGTYRTATLSIAFFDDAEEARRSQVSREAAFSQLQNSDCFETVEELSQSEAVEPSVRTFDGIAWATLLEYDYGYEDGDAGRREVYVWLEGTLTATLDVWVDDTEDGAEFVREQHRRAVAEVRDASRR